MRLLLSSCLSIRMSCRGQQEHVCVGVGSQDTGHGTAHMVAAASSSLGLWTGQAQVTDRLSCSEGGPGDPPKALQLTAECRCVAEQVPHGCQGYVTMC